MNRMLTLLVVLVALGCTSSTGPAGFTLHVEVVNETTVPNYWVNQSFLWQYLDSLDRILDQGTITIQSDSACITPPLAPPTTTRVMFSVPDYPNLFAPTQADWTVTVTPVNHGTVTWAQGLAHPCRGNMPPPIGPLPRTYALVSSGGYQTCGLTPDGVAYCWGSNTAWQLGTGGDKSTRRAPTRVAGALHFATIGAGGFQTCALTAAGAAYCWGAFRDSVPTAVAGGLTFVQLAAGGTNHQCALTAGGAAYCWGANYLGQLGDGDTTASATPVAVTGGITFASLTTSGGHSCGLTAAGAAYCWGFNNSGQLGDSTTTNRWGPVAVKGNFRFASVLASSLNTCALTSNGVTYCWGGANGIPATPAVLNDTIAFASLGSSIGDHICAVTSSGKGYCWGNDLFGQLGDGVTGSVSSSPVPIAGGLIFLGVNGGSDHSCGVTTAHVAYCWGYNGNGQVGTGSIEEMDPTPVPVITQVP
ncbi:MAG TPA: hypothetical protein VGU74_01945 [Gemmatimonadales bacterium]|nr:hypothetical protein [Gemmatimonadales bacterium]